VYSTVQDLTRHTYVVRVLAVWPRGE
jgi:hypothetical protein